MTPAEKCAGLRKGGYAVGFSLSISLFFIIIVFYIVIVQVFTILFRITGLTEEKARFQVISLLTNSGYTTKESELVVDVLARRRLARFIMLFGYTFSITIISVFVNTVTQLPIAEKDEIIPALITVSSLFVVFLILWRVPIVKTALDSVFEQWGRKLLYNNQQNVILVQDQYPRGVIASVKLNDVPKDLEGKTLAELQLPERFGVHVIFVNRGGVLQMDSSGKTMLEQGDVATVFGPVSVIRKIFANKQEQHSSGLAMAPKPETEQEFIHQQDVANAEAAAEAAQRAAVAEKEAAEKEKLAAESLERKTSGEATVDVLEKIKDAFGAGGPAPNGGHAEKPTAGNDRERNAKAPGKSVQAEKEHNAVGPALAGESAPTGKESGSKAQTAKSQTSGRDGASSAAEEKHDAVVPARAGKSAPMKKDGGSKAQTTKPQTRAQGETEKGEAVFSAGSERDAGRPDDPAKTGEKSAEKKTRDKGSSAADKAPGGSGAQADKAPGGSGAQADKAPDGNGAQADKAPDGNGAQNESDTKS